MPKIRVGRDGTGVHDGKTYRFPLSLAGAEVTVETDDTSPLEPARSAPKAEWVAYAEARGAEDADALTKDELIDRFGE